MEKNYCRVFCTKVAQRYADQMFQENLSGSADPLTSRNFRNTLKGYVTYPVKPAEFVVRDGKRGIGKGHFPSRINHIIFVAFEQ